MLSISNFIKYKSLLAYRAGAIRGVAVSTSALNNAHCLFNLGLILVHFQVIIPKQPKRKDPRGPFLVSLMYCRIDRCTDYGERTYMVGSSRGMLSSQPG